MNVEIKTALQQISEIISRVVAYKALVKGGALYNSPDLARLEDDAFKCANFLQKWAELQTQAVERMYGASFQTLSAHRQYGLDMAIIGQHLKDPHLEWHEILLSQVVAAYYNLLVWPVPEGECLPQVLDGRAFKGLLQRLWQEKMEMQVDDAFMDCITDTMHKLLVRNENCAEAHPKAVFFNQLIKFHCPT